MASNDDYGRRRIPLSNAKWISRFRKAGNMPLYKCRIEFPVISAYCIAFFSGICTLQIGSGLTAR